MGGVKAGVVLKCGQMWREGKGRSDRRQPRCQARKDEAKNSLPQTRSPLLVSPLVDDAEL